LLYRMVLGLCALLALAASPAIGAVSLNAAVRSALENRPFLRQAQAEAQAADAAAAAAYGGYLPQVSLQERYVRSNEPGTSLFIALNQEQLVLSPTADPYNHPPVRQDFETRVQVQQAVFDSDLIFGAQQASRMADAAGKMTAWTREQAAFAAFAAYLGVQRAEAYCAWAVSSLSEAQEIVRLADLRKQSGIGLKSDVLRARVQLAEAESRHLRADNDRVLAQQHLLLAMGQQQGDAEISGPIDPQRFVDADVSAQRADLQALQARVEAAKSGDRRESAAVWLPKVGVGASYSGHDPDQPFSYDADSWMVHGQLTWELFSGLRSYNAGRSSTYRVQAAEEALREAQRTADLQREEARLRAEEAQLQYETAQRAVAAAEESHHLLRERFASGLTDLSDLLGVQAALDRARADRVEAESGLVLARGRLLFEQGQLLNRILADEVQE